MRNLPQRHLLTDQTAVALRTGLSDGRWGDALPSESELCLELQVSRVTLRRALEQIAREGFIKFGGRGSHHKILTKPSNSNAPAAHSIRFLSPHPRNRVNTSTQLVQNALLERLSQENFSMHMEYHPGVFQRFSAKELERITHVPDAAGWILFHSTREIQEWFSMANLPCVVLGSCYPNVSLCNIEFDFRSSCRHAAGLFLARQHKELAFVTPMPMTAGDNASAEGFLDGVNKSQTRVNARIINYSQSVSDLCMALDQALSHQPRPTGFLVGWPEHTISLLGHLQKRGIRVPEDASVVCRADDQYLNYAVPSVARYKVDSERMGRKAAELMLNQIRHGSGKIRSIKIVPEFVPGESLSNAS